MGRAIKALSDPNGPADALAPKREAVALALASGSTLENAAKKAGVGTTTVKTWLTSDGFVRRVQQLRAEMTTRAMSKLIDGMSFAASTLRELLSADSEQVRLSAARSVIELACKLRDTVELEQRLAALEARRDGRSK